MARQFLVENKSIEKVDENLFKITGSEVKHIQVLRHNIGDNIKINSSIYEIIKMTKNEVYVKLVKDKEIKKRNIEVTLYLAVLKNEMMELSIKKATELGVDKIVPFFSKNVVVNLDNKEEKKLEKYKKIVSEAVKQCGRDTIPSIENFKTIEELDFKNEDVVFMAYEKEKANFKEKVLVVKQKEIKKIGIIIGPEGGFDEKEVLKLRENKNMEVVGLGSRILRAETAAISMISVINYEFEVESI